MKGIRVNMKIDGYDWIDPVHSTETINGLYRVKSTYTYDYKVSDMLEPPFEYDTEVEDSGYIGTPYENNVHDNRELLPGVGNSVARFLK